MSTAGRTGPNPEPPPGADPELGPGAGTENGAGAGSSGGSRARVRPEDRQILALAVPALGALVAEPLFLLADSAIVGRLGTTALAGLGIAGAVLASAASVFVFLAYGTTAAVARRLGAGDRPGALAEGVDGMWLAAALGVTVALIGWPGTGPAVAAFGPTAAVAEQARTYLHWALPGLPAMLVVMAATGVLRGLQDTRTPLLVAGVGSAVNAGLNLLLVHGIRMGIAGSALGTTLTQLGMAAATVAVVARGARRFGAPVRPRTDGIRAVGRAGVPLVVRTLALRSAMLVTTYAATALGTTALAAHQVVANLWSLLALALDALAIAGQALTGKALGAGDVGATRAATRRMIVWGVGGGAVLGLILLGCRQWLAPGFSTDPGVRSAMVAALVVAALAQPLCGYVFVLDGVLIGAGDGRYLAVAGVVQVLIYAPLALLVAGMAPRGTPGLVWLWVGYAGAFMLSRAVFLGLRERSSAWLVTGATR